MPRHGYSDKTELLDKEFDGGEPPDSCPADQMPCYVGKGTEDAHYRCGTSQCPQPGNKQEK